MPPRPVPDMLYGVIDGTGVPMTARETAGRDGKGEDGRARTREVKLAVFFNQHTLDKDGYPVRDRASSSYIATFEPASVFATWSRPKGSAAAPGTSGSSPSSATAPPGSGTSPPPRSPGHLHRGPLPRPPAPAQPGPLPGVHAERPLGDGSKPASKISTTATSTASRPPSASSASKESGKTRPRRNSGTSSTTRPACATTGTAHAACSPAPASRGRLQIGRRPKAQASRNALDHRWRRRHHRPALPRGQQSVGSHLQHPAHSDPARLTCPHPKMILVTYISDAHPLDDADYFLVSLSV